MTVKKRITAVAALLLILILAFAMSACDLFGGGNGQEEPSGNPPTACEYCGNDAHERCEFCQIHTCLGSHTACNASTYPLAHLADGKYTLEGVYDYYTLFSGEEDAPYYPDVKFEWESLLTVTGERFVLKTNIYSNVEPKCIYEINGKITEDNGVFTLIPERVLSIGTTKFTYGAGAFEVKLYSGYRFSAVISILIDIDESLFISDVFCDGCGVNGVRHGKCELCDDYLCIGVHGNCAPAPTCPGCGDENTTHEICDICKKYMCQGEHTSCFYCAGGCGEAGVNHESCEYCGGYICAGNHNGCEPDPIPTCPGCNDENTTHEICDICKKYMCQGEHTDCFYCVGGCGEVGVNHESCEYCGGYICAGNHDGCEPDPIPTCPSCGEENTTHEICDICNDYLCVGDHSDCFYCAGGCGEVGVNHESCEYCGGYICAGNHDGCEPDPIPTCPGCGEENTTHEICDICNDYLCVGDHSDCFYCEGGCGETGVNHEICDICNDYLCVGDHSDCFYCEGGCGETGVNHEICDICDDYLCVGDHSDCFYCEGGCGETGVNHEICDICNDYLCIGDHSDCFYCEGGCGETGVNHEICDICNDYLCIGDHSDCFYCEGGCGETGVNHEICDICDDYLCIGDHSDCFYCEGGCGETGVNHEICDICNDYLCVGDHSDCFYCEGGCGETGVNHEICDICDDYLCVGDHSDCFYCEGGCGETGVNHEICDICDDYLCAGNHDDCEPDPIPTCPGCGKENTEHSKCTFCGDYLCDENHMICYGCEEDTEHGELYHGGGGENKNDIKCPGCNKLDVIHLQCEYCEEFKCDDEVKHDSCFKCEGGCGTIGTQHDICDTCGDYLCSYHSHYTEAVSCPGCYEEGAVHKEKCSVCGGYLCNPYHGNWCSCYGCGEANTSHPYCEICDEMSCVGDHSDCRCEGCGMLHTKHPSCDNCQNYACVVHICVFCPGCNAAGIVHSKCSGCGNHSCVCICKTFCPGCNAINIKHPYCSGCGFRSCCCKCEPEIDDTTGSEVTLTRTYTNFQEWLFSGKYWYELGTGANWAFFNVESETMTEVKTYSNGKARILIYHADPAEDSSVIAIFRAWSTYTKNADGSLSLQMSSLEYFSLFESSETQAVYAPLDFDADKTIDIYPSEDGTFSENMVGVDSFTGVCQYCILYTSPDKTVHEPCQYCGISKCMVDQLGSLLPIRPSHCHGHHLEADADGLCSREDCNHYLGCSHPSVKYYWDDGPDENGYIHGYCQSECGFTPMHYCDHTDENSDGHCDKCYEHINDALCKTVGNLIDGSVTATAALKDDDEE